MSDSSNPFQPTSGDLLPSGANPLGDEPPTSLDVGSVIGRAWDLVKQKPALIAGCVLIPAIPNVLSSIVDQVFQAMLEGLNNEEQILMFTGGYFAVSIVFWVASLWLSLGQVRVVTRIVRGLDAEVPMLFTEAARLPSAVFLSILLGIIVGVGFLFLIVPGIIAAIGLSFAFYAMVDKDLSAIDALSESWRITDGHKAEVFFVNLGITFLGMVVICFTAGLGLFLAVPVLTLTTGVMYHTLSSGNTGDYDPAR